MDLILQPLHPPCKASTFSWERNNFLYLFGCTCNLGKPAERNQFFFRKFFLLHWGFLKYIFCFHLLFSTQVLFQVNPGNLRWGTLWYKGNLKERAKTVVWDAGLGSTDGNEYGTEVPWLLLERKTFSGHVYLVLQPHGERHTFRLMFSVMQWILSHLTHKQRHKNADVPRPKLCEESKLQAVNSFSFS